MGTINLGRVVMGGLLAGLVINIGEGILNIPILGSQIEAAFAAAGVEQTGAANLAYPLYGFLVGIVAVWLYAAVRPRFGPGPRTAVYVGLVVYVLVWFAFLVQNVAMPLFPWPAMWITMIWGLVEMPLATVAGAWVYKEA